MLSACGAERLTVAEFCELSSRVDAETARLVQLDPGSPEFQEQLDMIRRLNNEMFAAAPAEIADVADELGPMLTAADADNERVNQLLDRVAAFVENNCATGGG